MTGAVRSVLAGAALAALVAPALAADGKAVFETVCVACHQEGGVGAPGLAPPLVDPELWSRLGDKAGAYVTGVLVAGLSGKIEAVGQTYVGVAMPSQEALSDEELVAVATYVLHDLNHLDVAIPAPPRADPPSHKALRAMRKGDAP
ncbi:c-type cytochrome [Oharaeibacter diazotrophicus]|uniref:Cbb3-type cytochrome c oxidase subunit III n=1 Tax=Oharaeibacter diazotrophicus TaxID=1920512 RepID=A0A4R6RBQ3_9HYPH|nr:cytochrome c [Oharaeibacter diazotrophicus]TDP83581.1 cbb3-type cytochrome c oxidase subunit III [Oharaeibacter diazotrophicus]BBE72414.1 cytochrome c-552 precursor [Pleomorphomonas sp. SM30]GLS79184.1 hypothetical protein GCM10007904_45210 [Oharaeibacter diazotrophicus]